MNMIRIMKMFGGSMRVIAPCLRGFGYSSYKKPIASLKDLALDLILFIEEHLVIDKLYILGHSMGSVVGMYLAIEMQERVIGFI